MGNALVEFYPTPKTLIDKMLDGIDFNTVKTVLEPSAGNELSLRVCWKEVNNHIVARK